MSIGRLRSCVRPCRPNSRRSSRGFKTSVTRSWRRPVVESSSPLVGLRRDSKKYLDPARPHPATPGPIVGSMTPGSPQAHGTNLFNRGRLSGSRENSGSTCLTVIGAGPIPFHQVATCHIYTYIPGGNLPLGEFVVLQSYLSARDPCPGRRGDTRLPGGLPPCGPGDQ